MPSQPPITKLLLLTQLLTIPILALSQAELKVTQPGVSINDNGQNTPSGGAVLDVKSDTKGVIFPRLNTASRDAIPNPEPGLMVFNTDACVYQYYNGTGWSDLGVAPQQTSVGTPADFLSELTTAGEVTLTWADTIASEQGFRLERATNSAFTEGLTTVNLLANTTTYVDVVNPNQNIIYYYRLRAENGCQRSAYTPTESKLIYDPGAYGSNLFVNLDARLESNLVLGTISGSGYQVNEWTDSALPDDAFSYPSPTGHPVFYPGDSDYSLEGRNAVRFRNSLRAAVIPDFDFMHQGQQDFTVVGITWPEGELSSGSNWLFGTPYQGVWEGFMVFARGANRTDEYKNQIAARIIRTRFDPKEVRSAVEVVHEGVNVIAVTFDASTEELEITVKNMNGNKVRDQNTDTFNYNQGSTWAGVLLGQSNYFHRMPQFQIWKSVLSDQEIDEILDLLYEYYSGTP